MDDGEVNGGQGNRHLGAVSRRWPEGRPLCGAETRAEGSAPTCQKTAGEGTSHYGVGTCKRHLGSTRAHVAAAQKEQALRILNGYGVKRKIDPRDGVIEEYWRTAGIVDWLEARVQALDEQDLVWGVVEEKTTSGPPANDDGESGESSSPGREVKRKAARSVWLSLFQEERKKFSDLGVEIVRLGLEARRDEYRQRMGAQAQMFLSRAMDRVAMPDGMRAELLAALIAEMSAAVGQQPIEGGLAA